METKLTATELMIWDYAKLSKGNWSEIRQLELIDIEMIAEGVYFAEAIPLTAEILEKVGFVKHRDVFYRLAIHIDKFNGFMLTLGRDFDGVFCLQSNRFVRFSYVHELQHALRLCGINDKEIVL